MIIKLSDYCKKHSIHYMTGYRWFKMGKIPNAFQNDYGSIFINEQEKESTNQERIVIYCRVSNHSRKKELEYQVERCLNYAASNGLIITEIYKEVASGMNDNRKQFWKMLDSNPSKIIIENKDRLTRFGFNYIQKLLKDKCEIIVLNPVNDDGEDIIKDMVSVVTSFCCRLYGLRRGLNASKKIKNFIKENTNENID